MSHHNPWCKILVPHQFLRENFPLDCMKNMHIVNGSLKKVCLQFSVHQLVCCDQKCLQFLILWVSTPSLVQNLSTTTLSETKNPIRLHANMYILNGSLKKVCLQFLVHQLVCCDQKYLQFLILWVSTQSLVQKSTTALSETKIPIRLHANMHLLNHSLKKVCLQFGTHKVYCCEEKCLKFLILRV